jgi:hypothetical protein
MNCVVTSDQRSQDRPASAIEASIFSVGVKPVDKSPLVRITGSIFIQQKDLFGQRLSSQIDIVSKEDNIDYLIMTLCFERADLFPQVMI